MIGAIRDMYNDKIDGLKAKHNKEYSELRRFSRQLELTLAWLYMSDTVTQEQCDVIAAVRNGTLLFDALKEYTESQQENT